MNQAVTHASREITAKVSRELDRVGLLYRIFGRAKSHESVNKKLSLKKDIYSSNGKKMQDLIGIRITSYFVDDVDLIFRILRTKYTVDGVVRDNHAQDMFAPARFNVVCKLPVEFSSQVSSSHDYDLIDDTFEVQIRTILSEGWHEAEHDLRYKCLPDWSGHDDMHRTLNGILATLETCDWTMLKLFESLCYSNYKDKKWSAMLRQKFRVRLVSSCLSNEVSDVLERDQELAKALFRASRSLTLRGICDRDVKMPITIDGLVHVTNATQLRSDKLKQLEGVFLAGQLRELWDGAQADVA